MMTPNDVAQHRFATVRFSGYNTSEVDEFLDELTADYTSLYKENAVLKSKMKVLVEKVAEYRATEDDIRLTLLTARKTADTIKAEAEAEKQQMLLSAEDEVAERREQLRHEIENTEAQLQEARQSTLNFAAAMRALMEQQQGFIDREVEFLNRLDEIEAPTQPEALPEEADAAAEAIDTAAEKDAMAQVLADKELAAQMAAAEAAAVASPETAYQQALPSDLNELTEEPTRIVDMSTASDKDYQF